MKCINKTTGEEVKVGDKVTSFRGKDYTVKRLESPHKPSASGRIYTEEGDSFYVTVFDCKFVD
jgi:hypothetical protein